MNIIIFGATGATGTCLVDQALQLGHTVTAFVRDPARLTCAHPNLRSVVGDVLYPLTLNGAVAGHDAVVCALGTMPESKRDRGRRQRGVPVCSLGTRNILMAMAQHGVRRFVVESSACVGSSRYTGRFGAGHLVHLIMHDVMQDKERQEALVRESPSDWTIIRPVRLSNGALTGSIKSGEELGWGLRSTISRSDVAAFMIAAIADAKVLRRAITVSE